MFSSLSSERMGSRAWIRTWLNRELLRCEREEDLA